MGCLVKHGEPPKKFGCLDCPGGSEIPQVVLMWGSQLPNSFNLETSFNAVDWDSAVLQQLPTASAQQVALGGTAQWLRVYCTGGCSIQELQAPGGTNSVGLVVGEYL